MYIKVKLVAVSPWCTVHVQSPKGIDNDWEKKMFSSPAHNCVETLLVEVLGLMNSRTEYEVVEISRYGISF